MLGEKLRQAIEKIQRAAVLDKDTLKEAVKEMQRALIAADVEVKLVLELSKKIEDNAFKETPKGLSRREHITKLAYDSLAEILGGEQAEIPEKPNRILLCGLFGSGKTTSSAKIAKYYIKRGQKVCLIACDTFRAAAFEQLKQVSQKAGAGFFGIEGEKNAGKIAQKALQELKGYDLLICDSAGRSALDAELVQEIKEVHKAFKPEHSWLVLSADTGQLAKKQATAFHDSIGVTGVIITKTDGSAKGGGAISACAETKAKVIFIGMGEKVDDLQEFDAQRYLGRIMGYGDLQSLLEKAKEITEEEEIELDPEQLLKGEFNLEVFYKQLSATRKIGPIGKIAEMMGLKMQIPEEQLEMTEEKLDSFKHIMDSMTKKEKLDPETINRPRIERIAKGAGKKEEEIRELLKQFKQMKKMFKQFKKIGSEKDMEKLQKRGGIAGLFQGIGKKKKKFKIR